MARVYTFPQRLNSITLGRLSTGVIKAIEAKQLDMFVNPLKCNQI